MKSSILLSLIIALLFSCALVSCKNNSAIETDEDVIDSLEVDDGLDSLFQDDIEMLAEEENHSKDYQDEELKEAIAQIEEKYGEQWDFCTCIVKSDSINNALMGTDDDDEFDRIMERSEYVDSKCKELLLHPNSTPEERFEHEKRVKKCLEKS